MEIRTEIKIIEQTINTYIANDGMEFDTEQKCDSYEKYLLENERVVGLEKIVNATKLDADSWIPCDDEGYNSDSSFEWFKISTNEERVALNELYKTNLKPDQIPGIICVEKLSCDNDCYITTLTNCKKYVTDLFDKFGVDVLFNERVEGENE